VSGGGCGASPSVYVQRFRSWPPRPISWARCTSSSAPDQQRRYAPASGPLLEQFEGLRKQHSDLRVSRPDAVAEKAARVRERAERVAEAQRWVGQVMSMLTPLARKQSRSRRQAQRGSARAASFDPACRPPEQSISGAGQAERRTRPASTRYTEPPYDRTIRPGRRGTSGK